MSAFETFTETAQNVIDTACKETGKLVGVSKLKIDKMNTKTELEKQYAKLGKLVYNSGDAEEKAAVCEKITKLTQELEAIEEKIKAVKN